MSEGGSKKGKDLKHGQTNTGAMPQQCSHASDIPYLTLLGEAKHNYCPQSFYSLVVSTDVFLFLRMTETF